MSDDRDAESWYEFWGTVLFGAAVVVVLVTVLSMWINAVDRGSQRRARTAQACIEAGNVWLDDVGCVIARGPR